MNDINCISYADIFLLISFSLMLAYGLFNWLLDNTWRFPKYFKKSLSRKMHDEEKQKEK
jgi:hypothetical protein